MRPTKHRSTEDIVGELRAYEAALAHQTLDGDPVSERRRAIASELARDPSNRSLILEFAKVDSQVAALLVARRESTAHLNEIVAGLKDELVAATTHEAFARSLGQRRAAVDMHVALGPQRSAVDAAVAALREALGALHAGQSRVRAAAFAAIGMWKQTVETQADARYAVESWIDRALSSFDPAAVARFESAVAAGDAASIELTRRMGLTETARAVPRSHGVEQIHPPLVHITEASDLIQERALGAES